MDFEKICRICLEDNRETFDIYSSYCAKSNTVYSEMIRSCTKIKPIKEDGLPKRICKECTKQLKKTYMFNLLCETSDQTLRQYLDNLTKNHDETGGTSDVKAEDAVIKDEELGIYHNNYVKDVLDLLNKNDEPELDNIKLETNFEEERNDWDADDNIILREIKLSKELEDKPAKRRGRKKRVFLEGETAPPPDSRCPHQCDVCGKVLSTKSNLKAHKICHTELRPFKCTECPAAFRGHSALSQHKRTHTGETPYHCEVCSKQFRRRTGLVNHLRIHTGEKYYNCDICYKTFVQSAQLSIHMKRHKGEKSFLCQDCGKGFAIKADLRVHQRTHNGEKPYSCHICTKTFATSGNLSIHIRIHKKEIKYNCKECNRGFVTHSAYSIHMKRHKGQRDYRCECGKTFYTSSALKQHKVVHTGEKKYQCKLCERKFTQTSHLSRHFKRDHAKPNAPLPPSEHYKIIIRDERHSNYYNGSLDKIDLNTDVKREGPGCLAKFVLI